MGDKGSQYNGAGSWKLQVHFSKKVKVVSIVARVSWTCKGAKGDQVRGKVMLKFLLFHSKRQKSYIYNLSIESLYVSCHAHHPMLTFHIHSVHTILVLL